MGKKYCIFSAQYLPHMGGVENYTFHLAEALAAKGNKVTIAASNTMDAKDYELAGGIEIYRMPCFDFMNGRFPVLKMNRRFWKMNHRIAAEDYDLIIVNTRFYFHSLYAVIFGNIKKTRTIVIEHGTGHLALHQPVLDFMENIFEHTITFIERLLCHEFYGVSEACQEWLGHFHIKGKGTLYNAVDLAGVQCRLQDPVCSYRNQLHIPKDGIIISFTGRLLKEKGILTLIEVAVNICRENPNVYLLIAGDGEEREKVKKQCSGNIRWLGRITSEEVIALLKESDIFCLPSDSEGMPTSVLEAAACHTYIITTSRGGAKELLKDPSYGTIMENNDYSTVYHALKAAIADEAHRKSASCRAYERLAENFTWDATAEKLMNI